MRSLKIYPKKSQQNALGNLTKRLKESTFFACLISKGKPFHSTGAATVNATANK